MHERKNRGYFTENDGVYLPTKYAASPWSDTMLNGPCVSGLMARELEIHHAVEGFVPSRFTLDLFRPVRNEPITFTTTRVRDGNRIRVADANLMQGGEVSARATLTFLRKSAPPPGSVWTRGESPTPPPGSLEARPGPLEFSSWYGSDGPGWTRVRSEHQNSDRKRLWARQLSIIVGEELSPFVNTATVGEGTSFVTNWSDKGVGYINSDVTLALSRLPEGPEIGIEADNHISSEGIAVGTAVLFDRLGAFGTGVVTALANAQRQVDFG
ncbi:thioesterase family protein [Rhodococcus pyridinivorans]|uniref:acyl-CoA thioesterase domain-containing protein n=1 Tax=Rhodococcus pyridinivorans TaxID=103816 RepID=UPI001E58E1DB|nr:acyl-CoA thioesterase domain-containing protein [Rhodococcus pyridinivorans]MCD5421239.1 thioesterase family protein [Rhodococcus pyridinivorans]